MVIYNGDDSGGVAAAAGDAVVTVYGSGPVEYRQRVTSESVSDPAGLVVATKWTKPQTAGFIVPITKGEEVCFQHTALKNIDTLKYVQASDTGNGETVGDKVILFENSGDIIGNLFCINVEPFVDVN